MVAKNNLGALELKFQIYCNFSDFVTFLIPKLLTK
jgi:hypothetical protein